MGLLNWLRIRKVETLTRIGHDQESKIKELHKKDKEEGGDLFHKHRQTYKEKGVLPEKYEFGMNCFLDTIETDLRQAVYEELIKSGGIGTIHEAISSFGDTGIPTLFGVKNLTSCLEAYNRVAKRKKAVFGLDKRSFIRMMLENPDLELTFLTGGSGVSLHATTQKITDILLGSEPWRVKGYEFLQKGKYREAIECYDRAIEIEPIDAKAWHNKAVALGESGSYREAIKCEDKVLEIAPKYLWAWHNKAVSLSILKRYQEAVECYDKAIEINPKLAVIWENKARTLIQIGKDLEAGECLSKACELEPRLLKEKYRPLEWVDKIQEDWEKEGKNPTDDAFLWIDKSSEFWEQGDKAKALTCLQMAAHINPNAKIQLLDGKIVTAGGLVERMMGRKKR